MSDISEKIASETEASRKICAKLADRLINCLEDCDSADTQEVGLVVDMIKDLAEANEKTVKMLYYAQILEAMAGAEYGVDYDIDGPLKFKAKDQATV